MKYLMPLILFLMIPKGYSEVLWSDFSASYLQGSNYEVGDNRRTVFTFEHAAGYNWGDSFLFIDRLHSRNGDRETYAEFSPRLKLSSYHNSFIKDIYLSTTAEVGESFTNYLVGIGTNIQIPHFVFFKANLYYKNNDFGDNTVQSTLSWAVPIGPLMYDGFMDYVASSDSSSTSMNLTSQLKYNIGESFNLKSKLYIGIEYAYWINKFGIDGVDEKNVNLLVKYHF